MTSTHPALQAEPPVEHWLRQPRAVVALVPSEGFCVTAFRVLLDPHSGDPPGRDRDAGNTAGDPDGDWLPMVAEPPSWEQLHARPSFFGVPLLFPYAHVIAGGSFTYRGQQYVLRPGRARRVVHGLVRDYPWSVDRTWTDGEGDHIRASISTAPTAPTTSTTSNMNGLNDPGGDPRLAEFPFPFTFEVTYTLHQTTLTLEAVATNLSSGPMPIGFGIHPYFPLPLAPWGRVDDCVVQADVTHLVSIDSTGPEPRLEVTSPSGSSDLRPGQPVTHLPEPPPQRDPGPAGQPGRALHLTGIKEAGTPGGIRWALSDARAGLSVVVETGDAMRYLGLFVPPGHASISPVLATCVPDAFNLAARGYDSGVIELAPGGTWSGWARLTVQTGSTG